MKVLVTGATGFIGGNLVNANLAKNHDVRALALPNDPGIHTLKEQQVEVVEGDVRSFDDLQRAIAGCDVVYHCAAVVSDWAPKNLYEEVMVHGTGNLCRAALEEKISRLVYISTSDVFGNDESVTIDETHPLTQWHEPYPDYKIRAETVVWDFYEKGLPVSIVYPCWVYGEADKTFVPLLADAIQKKEMVFWRKNALVWPTYIENLMELMLLLSERPEAVGQGYIVHDGESITLEEFCAGLAKALGVSVPTLRIPYFTAYIAAIVLQLIWRILRIKTRPLLTTYAVKNLGSRLLFSIQKSKEQIGWEPRVQFAEGFRRTLNWLKAAKPYP
jgi:nucleoside-diphosphate-sugar epimerase